jgi:RNA polymerase sigma-70 factor (ECF subfamily)
MSDSVEDGAAKSLARRASQGDAACIDDLLVRYLPQLRQFIRAQVNAQQRLQESVSDLVQSTCRELVAAGPDFEWQGEARFRSWLFTAALNKIRMRLRTLGARKRQPGGSREGVDGEALPDVVAAANSASRIAMGHETAAELDRALDALAPDFREVIALARLAELPHAEVARIMDRSEVAVRSLLARAMVALTNELDRLNGRRAGQ